MNLLDDSIVFHVPFVVVRHKKESNSFLDDLSVWLALLYNLVAKPKQLQLSIVFFRSMIYKRTNLFFPFHSTILIPKKSNDQRMNDFHFDCLTKFWLVIEINVTYQPIRFDRVLKDIFVFQNVFQGRLIEHLKRNEQFENPRETNVKFTWKNCSCTSTTSMMNKCFQIWITWIQL